MMSFDFQCKTGLQAVSATVLFVLLTKRHLCWPVNFTTSFIFSREQFISMIVTHALC